MVYSVHEAAEVLGVSYHTVRQLIGRGEILASNIANPGSERDRFVIEEIDLLRYRVARLEKNYA